MFGGKKRTAKNSLGQRKTRYEQTVGRIKFVEKHVPGATRITKHPKYKHYVPPVVTVMEVVAALVFTLVVLPWIIERTPDAPFPTVNLPNLNFPRVDLPTIPLPHVDFPKLPKWLEDIMYWAGKTWPIWVAVYFAVREIRKNNKKK